MNWDYIAGFFDGEGCITHGRSKRYRIMISQTHKEVLESIRDFVGVGYVVEVAKRKSHWKDSWVFYIAKQEDSLKFLEKIVPGLIVKKQDAQEAIFALEERVKERKLQRERLLWRIAEARKLRNQGLTYREMGETLGIDFGYARRLVLGGKWK